MFYLSYLKSNSSAIIVTCLVAVLSLGILENGGDLMWYPSNLFWSGINPYEAYLNNPSDWFMSSVPNYPPLMYVLLCPMSGFLFGQFRLVWYLALVGLTFLVVKTQKKRDFKVFAFVILFLTNIHFYVGIRVGQLTPFIFLALCLDPKCTRISTMLLLSLKYSIGLPIYALLIWHREYWKNIIIVAFLHLISFQLFAWVTGQNILKSLGFLKVGPSSKIFADTTLGSWDVMSRIMMLKSTDFLFNYTVVIITVLVLFGYHFRKFKQTTELVHFGTILSLALFFHLSYDYMLLTLVYFANCKRIESLALAVSMILLEVGKRYGVIPEFLYSICGILMLLAVIYLFLKNQMHVYKGYRFTEGN